ncbi:MAG: PP2C family protein-serine/threonine phosphatase [Gallionellaceae bacterium]
MKFSICQASRIGGRKYNQDRVGYAYTNEALLMVLADGMGGHLHGEVAARLAVNTFMQAFVRIAQPDIADPATFLTGTMQSAHEAILSYAQDQKLGGNPGTTCVAALLRGGWVSWAHAGDSRMYLLRDGQVAALTHDHSIVQQWADYGIISQSETRTHSERNKITNCLGGVGRMFYVDPIQAIPLQSSSDVLLLCSDGLWGPLSDEELAVGFNSDNLSDSLETMMDRALAHAGSGADNTTAVVVRWGEAEEEQNAPTAICNVLAVDEEDALSEILGRTAPVGIQGIGSA